MKGGAGCRSLIEAMSSARMQADGTRGEPSELWGGETRGDTNGRKNARVPLVGAGWRTGVGVF